MDRRRFIGLALASGAAAGLGLAESARAAAFPYHNRRIPDEAHQVMGQLSPLGITAFAFTPTNGWVMVTRTGAHFARNIPQECYDTLVRLLAAGTLVNCVAFPPAGGNSWVITGHNAFFARNIPQECADLIAQTYASGQQVIDVAFPARRRQQLDPLHLNGFRRPQHR